MAVSLREMIVDCWFAGVIHLSVSACIYLSGNMHRLLASTSKCSIVPKLALLPMTASLSSVIGREGASALLWDLNVFFHSME
jgi:hypothetical protein